MANDADFEIDVITLDGQELFLVSWDVAPRPAVTLSPAEKVIAQAIVEGKTNAEIAAVRGTSARTVANQVATLLRKLKVASRYELVAALSLPSSPRP